MFNETIFSPPSDLNLPSSVVGTLSTAEGFKALRENAGLLPCDWVEFRGDLLGVDPEEIFALSSTLRSRGIETLYTLRLKAEGGEILNDDQARFRSLSDALKHVSAVDIEAASPFASDMVQAAGEAGRGVILSYHDFSQTPALEDVLNTFKSSNGHHVLLKVAGMIQQENDLWTLVDILRALSDRKACVMGMGQMGARSRIVLAGLGSLFTYGYLDHSAATGQMSCEDVRAVFQDWF